MSLFVSTVRRVAPTIHRHYALQRASAASCFSSFSLSPLNSFESANRNDASSQLLGGRDTNGRLYHSPVVLMNRRVVGSAIIQTHPYEYAENEELTYSVHSPPLVQGSYLGKIIKTPSLLRRYVVVDGGEEESL